MKLLGNISVDFDTTAKQLIRYSAFTGHYRKNGTYINYLDFRKAYVTVRREALHNILTEFSVPMKQDSLID
jgi:hypothetical protein